MNLSGKAVNYWINELKLKLENTLIVNDDISIPFGVLRMRKKGSDGGHNGLKDINNVLQTQQYPRLLWPVQSLQYSGFFSRLVSFSFVSFSFRFVAKTNEKKREPALPLFKFVAESEMPNLPMYSGG